MDSGYSKWRKLDNAALAFPLVTGKDDTRVFRFYCELKEPVVEETLQAALDETMKRYPLFQAVLRKGLFWFYLERREIRPVVHPEKKPPCSRLYIPDKKSLLFEVSYYQNRINFEVFHGLTDGTGAMHFLVELVQNYLILRHPAEHLPRVEQEEVVTPGDQEEDSFSQYYSAKLPRGREKKPDAVKLRGEKLVHEDMHITELELSVKEVHAQARAYGVSITVLLTAVMLCAIHEEVPKNRQNKPITLMVPVNLRNYFPSQSMGNFFGWIEAGHVFTDVTTFEEVVRHVGEQFERELVKERIAVRMNDYVRLEKNPLLRAVPLEIKKGFLMLGANLGSRCITAVYSNIGRICLPEQYGDYIRHFGFFTSTNVLQLCSCSYGDKMVLGFTSKLPDDRIPRNFQRILKEHEIKSLEIRDGFPVSTEAEKLAGRKAYQIFTFLCIAAAVICGMIDYMMTDGLNWFWFAAVGCACAWTIVSVAYTKRRNILKNEMWQLLLVTVLSIIWDHLTGWRGWSLDFIFPFGALAVLISMLVIAKVNRLEQEEYLFYLVQASVAGCIPALLVWLGLIHIVYPSVVCAGISILVLAALFIFQKKDTLAEFRKKLRM